MEYFKQKVFSLQGIEVGSIIEFRYELISSSVFFLGPWHFQNDAFTLKSQFKLIYPKRVDYDFFLINSYGFNIQHEMQKGEDPYDYFDEVTIHEWKLKDIPALREEPFMYNKYDNYAKVVFQLKSFQFFIFTINLSNSWTNIVRIQSEIYNSILEDSTGIDSLASSLNIEFMSPASNARNLYNYVRDNINLVEKDGFVNDSLPQIITSQKATAIEKNLFLLSLLREAGYEADLLLISTRENGKFSEATLNRRHLNHVMVYLSINRKNYILDCTNKFCPFGILPTNCNVDKGVLIKNDKMKIIPVFISNLDNKIEITTDAAIKQNGELECKSHLKITGIPAIIDRTLIDETNVGDFINKYLSQNFTAVVLDTFYVPNYFIKDSPLDIWIHFRIPEYAQSTENIMYFEPPLLSKVKENPFVSETRNFPIDYEYEIFESEFIYLTIPQGYKVEDIPERSKEIVDECTFNSLIFTGDKSIEIRRNFRLKQLSFYPKYYKQLKNLYDVMVQSDQSQIVLTK